MNGTAELLVVAQIAIVLAGFAGVVAAYEFKDLTSGTRGDALGLALIVHCGLLDALVAILPLAIYSLGVSEQTTWRIGSGIHSVNYLVYFLYVFTHLRKIHIRKPATMAFFVVLFALGLTTFIVNLLNTLNVGYHGEFGPFFVGCIFPLLIAGYMFARLVLRPLWRNIRAAEA